MQTGTQRAWDIAWLLDNGRRFKGPDRPDIVIGADSQHRGEFEGSIAEVMILRDPVAPEDADCMFNYGQTQVGICVPQDQMWSRDFFETMLLDSNLRYGSRAMNGDHAFFVDTDGDGAEKTSPEYVLRLRLSVHRPAMAQ